MPASCPTDYQVIRDRVINRTSAATTTGCWFPPHPQYGPQVLVLFVLLSKRSNPLLLRSRDNVHEINSRFVLVFFKKGSETSAQPIEIPAVPYQRQCPRK